MIDYFLTRTRYPMGDLEICALPLQFHSREEGNTLFLDDQLNAYPDQWSFLNSLRPIPAGRVESPRENRRLVCVSHAMFNYIEMFYNPMRRHRHNDRVAPAVYEQRYFENLKSV